MRYYVEIDENGIETKYEMTICNKSFACITHSAKHNKDYGFEIWNAFGENDEYYFLKNEIFTKKIKKENISGLVLLKNKNSLSKLKLLFDEAIKLKNDFNKLDNKICYNTFKI